jgi:integrase
MATIEKRKNAAGEVSYRVKVRLTGYPPETNTFERLTDAKDWAQRTESNMKAGKHFGMSKRFTFGELVDKYKPLSKDTQRLEFWRVKFGTNRLDTVTTSRIDAVKQELLAEDTVRFATPPTGDVIADAKRKRAKRTGASVNRYLAELSVCLNHGVRPLGWLEKNPCDNVKRSEESKGRTRYLTDDERPRLLDACRPHDDLYLAVLLALTTGARQAEVMTLRWKQIDLKRQVITLDKTKNGETRSVPIVGEALKLLTKRAKVRSLTDDRIFPPTGRAKKAECLDLRQPWEKALKEAGITDFHWHDLRHTAASYLAMSGVSLVEISKVLGHRTMQMVSRYSHLSDGHIVETGEKLAKRLGV